MKKQIFIRILALTVALALLLAGCAAPAANQATVKPGAADTQKPDAAPTDKAASAEPTTAASEAPAGPKDIASSPAFKYYIAVKLGMTKDEADKAIGLEPKASKSVEGSFDYVDGDGNGVYIVYNKDMKAFSKVAIYAKESAAVAPLTAKPVTKDQKKQISKGASYDDVVALLGGNGVEVTQTATEKNPTATPGLIFHWANADGSYIQVSFDPEGKAQNIMYRDAR